MKHYAIHKGEYQEGRRRSRERFGIPFFVGYITLIFGKFFSYRKRLFRHMAKSLGGCLPLPQPYPYPSQGLSPTGFNLIQPDSTCLSPKQEYSLRHNGITLIKYPSRSYASLPPAKEREKGRKSKSILI
jgi:hypothetical protein